MNAELMLCSKICYAAAQTRYHRSMGYTHPIAFLKEPRKVVKIKPPKNE